MTPIRLALALAATVAMLLPAGSPVQAASCNGASHQPSLRNGAASPGSGTVSTAITFSVVYADTAGCPPSSVTITISGVGTRTLPGGGRNYTAGVKFSRTMTLPIGRHSYSFRATSGTGNGVKTVTLTSVNPAKVVIRQPSPTPTPKPRPTPSPAPTASPQPVVAPTPTATPKATRSPKPTPRRTEGPTPSASPARSAKASGTRRPRPSATVADHDSWIDAPPWAGSGSGTPSGPSAPGGLPLAVVVAAYVTSTSGGLLLYWFVLKRRSPHDDEPAMAPIPATAGVAMDGPAVPDRVTPLPPMRELIPPVNPHLLDDPDAHVAPRAGEQGVPRWLRPSLRDARHAGERYRRGHWE